LKREITEESRRFLHNEGHHDIKDESFLGNWSGKRLFPERKLLVLDLDETLVHTSPKPEDGDVQLTVKSGSQEFQIGLSLRPHMQKCLQMANQLYEVAVFTSAQKAYADTVLDFLDPDVSLIHHRLYRQNCTWQNGSVYKDLRIFQSDLKDTIICDNLISNFALQLDNGVPIKSWIGDKEDQELVFLMEYLEKMASAPDVRVINRRLFQLETLLNRSDSSKSS
jgi:CTD small phosphatase-like protein 2